MVAVAEWSQYHMVLPGLSVGRTDASAGRADGIDTAVYQRGTGWTDDRDMMTREICGLDSAARMPTTTHDWYARTAFRVWTVRLQRARLRGHTHGPNKCRPDGDSIYRKPYSIYLVLICLRLRRRCHSTGDAILYWYFC